MSKTRGRDARPLRRIGHWLSFLPGGMLNIAGEAWVEHRSVPHAWREWLS